MLRIKLITTLLVTIGLLTFGTLWVTSGSDDSVADELAVRAEDKLKSGNEVVRLTNRVKTYSLLWEARSASEREPVVDGMQCPETQEELEAWNSRRAQRAPQQPEGGEEAAAPAAPTGPTFPEACRSTRHEAVLSSLRAWNSERATARSENLSRFINDREIGLAVATEPDLLIASDADGVVVARVGFDKDDWYGPSRLNMNELPVVGRTQQFGVQHDIIHWRENENSDPKMAQVAAAPMFATNEDGEEEYVGSVLIGYFMTNDAAEEDSQFLYGIDVIYFYSQNGEGELYGNSLGSRPGFVSAIRSAAFTERGATGDGQEKTFQQIISEGLGVQYIFEHEEETFYVVPTRLALDRADQNNVAGFLVLTSKTAATAPLDKVERVVPALAAGLFVLGILAIIAIVKQFLTPIEEISKGIQEVIAGNKDYMWPVNDKSFLSDMSHSLNIMSAILQGKREPDTADSEGDAEWQAMVGGGGAAKKPSSSKPVSVGGLGGLRGRSASKGDDDNNG